MIELMLVLCVMFGPGQEPHCHRVPTTITYESMSECEAKAVADGGPLLMQAGREAMAAGVIPIRSGIACRPQDGISAKHKEQK